MANLVFKAGIVAIIGNHGLARHLAMLFGLTFLGGVAILMFWPG
jgi:hypothetical protein